jgi:ankyrin repeat protein
MKSVLQLLARKRLNARSKRFQGLWHPSVALAVVVWSSLVLCGCGIHHAAETGNLVKIKKLVEADPSSVFAKDSDSGETPLHYAAENDHRDVAEFLLANHAEVNANDNVGWTPLHRVAYRESYSPSKLSADVAKLLLARGADVNARDKHNDTPLHLAAESKSKDVTAVLLAAGAEIDSKDNWGETPLHWAAKYGSAEVVELLLASGANANVQASDGRTPSQFAADKGRTDIADLLAAKEGLPMQHAVATSINPAATAQSGSDSIEIAIFKLSVPKGWTSWPARDLDSLRESYESNVPAIYQRYNQATLPANIATVQAFKSPDGQRSLVVILMQLPPIDGLFDQLRNEAADKAKWGIQQGYITHASKPTTIKKVGFDGFVLTVSQSDQSCTSLAGLMHDHHPGQMLSLQLMASKDSHLSEEQTERQLDQIAESVSIK